MRAEQADRQALVTAVDEAGRLKGAKDQAQADAGAAVKVLRGLMKALAVGEADGLAFRAQVVSEESLRVAPQELAKLLKGDALWACLRVDMEAARKAVPAELLESHGTVAKSSRLEIRPL